MKYVVIGTPVCGYCRQAKSVLEMNKLEYDYKCLTEVAPAEQDRLMKVAGQEFRTVPQIFTVEGDDWSYVGGYTELAKSLK
jgi:glutaredoxin